MPESAAGSAAVVPDAVGDNAVLPGLWRQMYGQHEVAPGQRTRPTPHAGPAVSDDAGGGARWIAKPNPDGRSPRPDWRLRFITRPNLKLATKL